MNAPQASLPTTAQSALAALWREAKLNPRHLAAASLPQSEPGLASSFPLATALQASLGAAALAAAGVGRMRGGPEQTVSVEARPVLQEASARFSLDGVTPDPWDKLSGLYPCGADAQPGWVRIHANFAHHRDGALRLLGLASGNNIERAQVAQALRRWRAEDFEQAAADAGLAVAALRSFEQWNAHPHSRAVAALPPVAIERIAEDEPAALASPLTDGQRPLEGLRVLDLTRILAGPVAGRTLAAYGAEVMLVNSPHLPNIEAIADTSRGKLSVHLDLKTETGRDTLRKLVSQADIFLQAYRPGALEALGFAPAELARLRPGIVCVSLSAYGDSGLWAGRRGFDSLVQTATGFNQAEAAAFGQAEPKALPLQVLDYGAGFLSAFGALAALLRQPQEGGSWHVKVSLAGTGHWLRSLGRCQPAPGLPTLSFDDALETTDSGFGRLQAVRHAARFSQTPPAWVRPSMPPGAHPAIWPPR